MALALPFLYCSGTSVGIATEPGSLICSAKHPSQCCQQATERRRSLQTSYRRYAFAVAVRMHIDSSSTGMEIRCMRTGTQYAGERCSQAKYILLHYFIHYNSKSVTEVASGVSLQPQQQLAAGRCASQLALQLPIGQQPQHWRWLLRQLQEQQVHWPGHPRQPMLALRAPWKPVHNYMP